MLHLLSAPLQDGLCFFQLPLPAIATAPLAGTPASRRRKAGFTVFDCDDTNELAPVLYTGSLNMSVCPTIWMGAPDCVPFWSEPVSVFGSSKSRCLRRFTCVGLFIQPVSPTSLTLVVVGASSRRLPSS